MYNHVCMYKGFDDYIDVPSRHTDDMIRHETDAMMGFGPVKLCLGHAMQLAQADSPYIYGGDVSEADVLLAMGVLGVTDMDMRKFHDALNAEMEAAFRPYELLDDDDKPGNDDKSSDIRIFGPEWLSDIIRCACEAVPSITLHDALWSVPLCMMMHLNISIARKNGATTRRPVDMKAAMRLLRERNRRKKKHEEK